MSQELLDLMRKSIVDGDADASAALAAQGLATGLAPLDAIEKGFVPGLEQVGDSFSCGDLHLPDMMLAARAMKAAVDVLEPAMKASGAQRQVVGRVVIGADLVGVSALLTTTMTGQRAVIDQLAAAGLRPGVNVIVGGAPVTHGWAEEIGADGYSEDGVSAVALARRLIGIEG
jgi:methanogenic corrinoid protein MtbC1